ncbi:putative receptor-like cytosolic serine/threonine-protein kinase RBK1 isoform X1 [Iris pallida]|uniref:Receptor-like cytosolic serine/threonine-protein kinase RBK1 isoform X1 n=1 Tax=Iris pallida TaxID=29817 RepID=A0AAX6G2C4_IRIPA|nr:putative receptor-like cytosolic serine/threonine-protein kinase RBK1 isoform X1 [Iris pallida]
MHDVNRGMLWIWEGCASVWFATFLFHLYDYQMWLDYVLWFGCLSGMKTTDVGYVYFVFGLCCGWTSDGCLWWDMYCKLFGV